MLKSERRREEIGDFATRATRMRSRAQSLNPSRAGTLYGGIQVSFYDNTATLRSAAPAKYRAATCLLTLSVVHGSVCCLRTPPTKSSSRCTGCTHNHGYTLGHPVPASR